jgi:hypothetical protein
MQLTEVWLSCGKFTVMELGRAAGCSKSRLARGDGNSGMSNTAQIWDTRRNLF